MKRFSKIFTFIVMVAVCAVFAFASPMMSIASVLAATVTTKIGATISVSNIPSKGKIGEQLVIPKGTSAQGDVKVIVKNPRGQVVYSDVATANVTITPSLIGDYTVQYVVVNAISGYFATESQVYTVAVSGTKPTISFLTNEKNILPSIIDEVDKVVLPLPVITEEEVELEHFVMLIKSGSHAETNNSTTNPNNYPVVWVSAKSPEYNAVDLERNEDGKIVFNASKTTVDPTTIYGTYTVTYNYQSATGLEVKKTVTIDVDKDYKTNVSSKINMTFVWADGSSMPTSAVLGQEVSLPSPVGQDKNQSNAELKTFTQVKVDFIPNGNLEDTTQWISYAVNQQDFTFTPMNKTENGGYYRIEYTIKNFFEVSSISRVYSLYNVTDTVRPTVYLVKNYTDANDVDTTVDLSYEVPNKVITSTLLAQNDIVLPAIFAKDNYVEYSGLTLRRYWINGSTETRIDTKDSDGNYITNKSLTLSVSEDESNKTPDTVKTCLKTAGTYSVRYEAYDGTNTQRSMIFEIVVVNRETFSDVVTPRITMPTIDTTVFSGDTLTFKAPSAVDYASTSLSEVNIDTKICQLEVGYYYGNDYAAFLASYENGDDVSSNASFHKISKLEGDANYYSFTVPTETAGNELYVLVRATDNAKYSDSSANNVAVKSKEIRLVSVSSDTTPPTFDMSQILPSYDEYDQNEKVKILSSTSSEDFVFASEDADFVSVIVKVYDPNGKEINVKGKSTKVNNTLDEITVGGAWFMSTLSGDYTVLLSATDLAGNSIIVSYKIAVADTQAPIIEVSNIPTTVEVGTEITFPRCIVIDNGEVIENYTVNEVVFVGDNPSYTFNIATYKFIAKETGTFTFEYHASDGLYDTISSTYTIIASDTTNPAFEEYDWEETAALIPVLSDGVETGHYELVEIPYIAATDANGMKEISVTIADPDGETLKTFIGATELNANNNYEFEPTSADGSYTITYKATDIEGNSTTIEKTLKVGDVIKPVITIKNESTNLPTTAKINSKLKISADDMTLTDNKDGSISVDDYMKNSTTKKFIIKIENPSGDKTTLTKSSGYYEYTFESAGTYTLTYTLTDQAGNVATRTSTIVVEAEESSEDNVTVIWGTVLIVASVLLLGGVIVYFVVSNKKGKNSKNKSLESAKENAKKLDK